ncbi:unnamed protein product [Sphagnum jensenii]|uniref:Uncharacterized protein n=1 Tax=Sphagnum jensenii TaxID=128206 RepID=A0ABP1BRJ2_9BRYO
MLTWRSMVGAEAEPPSVQWSASVVFGVVMEIAKLMVPLICIALTVYGLYKNRCRPRAVQSRASSSPDSSTPPPTEAMGIPGAMEILNSIEGSLQNVPTSVISSDNDTVVLDSTNMVVIEMGSLALPA